MPTLNYTRRLENLQNRKFDRELSKSVMSESLSAKTVPANIKYLVESMRPIDKTYNDKTIVAAERVQEHLKNGFDLTFTPVYKRQGSVTTNTNIKVHSDFDLLVVINDYHFLAPGIPVNDPYTKSDSDEDMVEFRKQATKILKGIYDEVDTSGEKSISVVNKSLHRKIDVVFCYWYHGQQYIDNNSEYYRGVSLYNFTKKARAKNDFPFAHIHQVNSKGDNTFDGSRRGIRLLKTLRADSETSIDLSSFQLTSIVHPIENLLLRYSAGNELAIAKAISAELKLQIDDSSHRQAIVSPNGIEKPLYDDKVVPELKKLKTDLDTLIEDTSKEILSSRIIEKAMMTY